MSVVEVNKLNGVPDFVRAGSAVHRNMKLTNSFGIKEEPAAIPRPLGPSRKLKNSANPSQGINCVQTGNN